MPQTYGLAGTQVKVEDVSIPTSFRTPTDDEVSEVLEDIMYPGQRRKSIFTFDDLSKFVSRSERHARRYAKGEQPLTAAQFIRIAVESLRRGCRRFIDLVIPPNHALVEFKAALIDDDVDDELGEIVSNLGMMRECYLKQDIAGALDWLMKAKDPINRLDLTLERRKRPQ
jgi:hypothetical protein